MIPTNSRHYPHYGGIVPGAPARSHWKKKTNMSAFAQCLGIQSKPTLVIVEQPMIAKLIQTMLRREDYQVIVTVPANAAAILGQPQGFLLVTNRPEDFLEFAATARLLYLSGTPDLEIPQRFHRCRVVRKPFGPSELIAAIKELAAL
jgi:hypothetical protein